MTLLVIKTLDIELAFVVNHIAIDSRIIKSLVTL